MIADDEGVRNPNGHQMTIPVKLLRWKMVLHKINRVMNLYSGEFFLEGNRLRTVLDIFSVFMQTMEHHPNVLTPEGVGAKHSA